MKLLFDQNLSPKLVMRLADLFPGSCHVQSAGLDCANDDQVWEHARRNGYQGTIVLEVVILPDGSTSEPRVVQQYDKGLEQSAVRAVRKWRYKPLIGPGGTPVRAGIFVEVDYSLISR